MLLPVEPPPAANSGELYALLGAGGMVVGRLSSGIGVGGAVATRISCSELVRGDSRPELKLSSDCRLLTRRWRREAAITGLAALAAAEVCGEISFKRS